MAASAYGIEISEQELGDLCCTDIDGTLIEDLQRAATALGLVCRVEDSLIANIDCKRQLIIAYLNLDKDDKSALHAVLLVAFDENVAYYDPLIPPAGAIPEECCQFLPKRKFMAAWRQAGYSALVISGFEK